MRKRVSALSVILALASSAPQGAIAQDHLEPESSIFSEFSDRGGYYGFHRYYDDVLTALNEAFARGVTARVIVFPSFHPEFAVAIRNKNDRYSIIHLEPEKQIWSSWHERYDDIGRAPSKERRDKTGDDAPIAVNILRCEMSIPSDLGQALTDLWIEMLRQTKFSKKHRLGLDGVTFHFSAEDTEGFQRLAGKVWTPREETATAELAEITLNLKEICLAGDASQFSIIMQKAETLRARVAALEAPTP